MRILLVKPKWFVKDGVYRFLTQVTFEPLHLGILAALSPGHNVRLIDNDRDEIPFDQDFDLVGITATSFTSHRAFDIADAFRNKRVPVVIGGVHACLMPEECLQHADAIVIGEAEYAWPRLIEDAAARRLQKIYRQDRPTDMDDVPVPRRDLMRSDPLVGMVQATRGCNHSCKFCYLPSVPWHQHRRRSIDKVYQEIQGMPQKIIFFVDDNLFVDEEYAIALCNKIAPLKKAWSVQAPTTITRNTRLLEAMRRSGCFFVQVGFQTVHPDSLRRAGVVQNKVEHYQEVVRRFHQHGILVQGFFIFGFDSEDARIFEAAEAAIRKMDIEDALLYILTPYPGTPIYDQLKRDGRLLSLDREKYGWANAVFKPARMTAQELERGVQKTYENLYPFFKKRAPAQIIKWLPLFLRHPRIFILAWQALHRRIRIG
ncbi:MAG TPA: radical SAM protein, partial [Candidatus Paceibacterota bacterium]|nr:radical SAM protein [Verrucomicrobiota bacterium]HRZ44275.1 radical SAM protein [Candidatus Paceibacterota bacterium]